MTDNPANPPALPAGVPLPKGVDRLADLGTLLTIKETAARLGLSAKTVRRMIERGALAGAHQVPMPSGKGSQWVVPYSSVVEQETRAAQAATPDPAQTELAQLRDQVASLEQQLTVQRALADERAAMLEQLHMTWRLSLTSGQPETPRRRWGRKPRNK